MRLLSIILFSGAMHSIATYECDPEATECFTTLTIENQLTMRHLQKYAVYPSNGKLYKYDVTDPSSTEHIPTHEVISVDGWEETRMVLVANGSLPGPPIIAYRGQQVTVHVINKLLTDTVSIHWHGLPQLNNLHNDGVAHVTQCPLLPSQNFTYKFVAEPSGTFWYHSHSGTQRNQGLYGALIIHDKDPDPEIDGEHIMALQEWSHDWDPGMDYYQYLGGIYQNRTKSPTVYKQDMDWFGSYKFHSGLINGKGRYYNDENKHNEAPLEVYNVQRGKAYRFRIISAAAILPFRVSIDNHNITVIASDGHGIQPVTAESVIIQGGERYDVIVHADQPVGNYWIRARTLELGYNHSAEAILRYDGAPEVDPQTARKKCSSNDTCKVINCPFSYYSEFPNTECIWFIDLKADAKVKKVSPAETGKFQEHILNFGFPGTTWWPGTINAKKLEFPHNTNFGNVAIDCDKSHCVEEKLCICTHTLNLRHGDVIQLVFSNTGLGKGGTHPIHLHGYAFHVLKMGFGKYNETNGHLVELSPDIKCSDTVPTKDSFCSNPRWSNTSWNGGHVPGLEIDRAPLKDTITIPRGGYVVTRIHADNPGLWLIHCHVSLHHLDTMAMILNVSKSDEPNQFPVCGTLHPSKKEIYSPEAKDPYNQNLFWGVTGILIAVILIETGVIVYQCHDKRREYKI